MRISLNLATRPFTDLGPAIKRLRVAAIMLAILCILLGVCLHLYEPKAKEARARERAVDNQIAAIRAERQNAEATMRKPANAELLAASAALNQLFDEKAFSWTLAMESLETVLPAGVQVTAIEPTRAKDGQINVHMRVVGPRDRSVELVRNLEHSRRFLEPRIMGETAESTGGPNQRAMPVSSSDRFSFDLTSEYNPPAPEERAAVKDGGKSPATAAGDLARQPMLRAVPETPRPMARPPYAGPQHPVPGGPQ
jgi:type IV pilus assembly protein PilN